MSKEICIGTELERVTDQLPFFRQDANTVSAAASCIQTVTSYFMCYC